MRKRSGEERGVGRDSRRLGAAFGHATRGLGLLSMIVASVASSSPATSAAASAPAIAAGDALEAAWSDYKARHVAPDGRVMDDANGGVSHSEGQGFGMLLAAGLGDERAFALIWNWTARELYRRPDGLASWRWVPASAPHLTDPNNATDGDLLIAWALLRASERWNKAEYRAAARRIALAVGRHATFRSRFGLALKPAVSGFDASDKADGPLVNLSYWVFPALAALPEVAPEVDWHALIRTGLALLDATRLDPTRLPPDWTSLAGRPVPAENFPPMFSYDAVRVPLYLAWSGLGTSDAYAPFLRLVQDGAAPAIVDVSTGLHGAAFREPGYRAVFDLVACALDGSRPLERGGSATPSTDQHYYPSSLQLLSALAAHDRGLRCS